MGLKFICMPFCLLRGKFRKILPEVAKKSKRRQNYLKKYVNSILTSSIKSINYQIWIIKFAFYYVRKPILEIESKYVSNSEMTKSWSHLRKLSKILQFFFQCYTNSFIYRDLEGYFHQKQQGLKVPEKPVLIKINEKTQKLQEVPLGRFHNEI